MDEEEGDADPLVGSEYTGEGLGSNQLTVLGSPVDRRIRFCRKCSQYKPPRCHHCSVCELFELVVFFFSPIYFLTSLLSHFLQLILCWF